MDTVAQQHPSTREFRGIALAASRAEEIVRLAPFVWSVPASSPGVRPYVVNVETGRCNCLDQELTSLICKHIFAATICSAKGRASLRRS